jgi:hypothetical protein
MAAKVLDRVVELKNAELKAAVVDAVQECGRLNGWADGDGNTTVERWHRGVAKDGVFKPIQLHRWMREGKEWFVEPLLELARIMRHYGVLVDGKPMPHDYFVSILINGKYEKIEPAKLPDKSSPQWAKQSIREMSLSEQTRMLAWLADHVNREFVKEDVKS